MSSRPGDSTPDRATSIGAVNDSGSVPEHPWRGIDLDVYERHMGDSRVGQLRKLHDITGDQLAAYPARTVAILGVAGGNGLDLIDPNATTAVFGYDINANYLAACETRYRARLGDRLHLIEATVDRSTRIEHVDLLIANLLIEYIGVHEYVAFAAGNADCIGVLSSVIQCNDESGFVSSTDYATSFDALASVSADIDPDQLNSAMSDAGFIEVHRSEHHLPNGKTLVRQDFRPTFPAA